MSSFAGGAVIETAALLPLVTAQNQTSAANANSQSVSPKPSPKPRFVPADTALSRPADTVPALLFRLAGETDRDCDCDCGRKGEGDRKLLTKLLRVGNADSAGAPGRVSVLTALPVCVGAPLLLALELALDAVVPVALVLSVLGPATVSLTLALALPELVPVPLQLGVQLRLLLGADVRLAVRVPVADAGAACKADAVAVPVSDGTLTSGSLIAMAAARSTGLTPVIVEYASRKPDADRESSSGDEPPSSSLACGH